MNEQQKRFQDILSDFDNAMLTTIGGDGRPRSRPMRVAEVTDKAELWFVTNRLSDKVAEIQSNSVVAITMQSNLKFLSLTGTARIVDDQSQIKKLWSDSWKIWFPDGHEDPSLTLLKIAPEEGEYWDMSGLNALRYLYEAGQAYFRGESIDTEAIDDMNAKAEFSS